MLSPPELLSLVPLGVWCHRGEHPDDRVALGPNPRRPLFFVFPL